MPPGRFFRSEFLRLVLVEIGQELDVLFHLLVGLHQRLILLLQNRVFLPHPHQLRLQLLQKEPIRFLRLRDLGPDLVMTALRRSLHQGEDMVPATDDLALLQFVTFCGWRWSPRRSLGAERSSSLSPRKTRFALLPHPKTSDCEIAKEKWIPCLTCG